MLTTFSEIQEAILSLPKADYARFRRWLDEHDWEEWDVEIEADSDAGKLEFLVAEATETKQRGKLADL